MNGIVASAGVILQPQPVTDLIKESFFGGSMDHFPFNKFSIILYNVHSDDIAKWSSR
jgi:hypothetical protein